MTLIDFQNELVKEIKSILSNRLFQKAYSEERVPINVYSQSVPLEFKFEDEVEEVNSELQKAPFITVRLMDAQTGNIDTPDKAKVYFHVCIYDDNFEKQGHLQIIEIYETMRYRFLREQVVGKYYRANEDVGIQLVLQDEDTYPFYFGGMAMEFELPVIRKEDNYC